MQNDPTSRRSRRASFTSLAPLALFAGLALVPVAFGARALATQDGAQEHGEEHEDGGELHEVMEELKSALRPLGRGITAESRGAALERLAAAQSHVITAKSMTPPLAEGKEGDTRSEFVDHYRKEMVEVLAKLCEVELAVLGGNYEEATRLCKEDLRGMEKHGHEEFRDAED